MNPKPARVPVVMIGGALMVTLFTACERRGIEVYTVPKEEAVESASEASESMVQLPEIFPENWIPADTAGGPRVASFQVTAEEGETADMAVTVFPGDVGGLLANVNRWRGEVSQPNITEAELPEATERIEVSEHTVHMVDAASSERRTLGAILPLPSETYFFKLSGSKATVSANRDAFYTYVKGTEVAEGAGGGNLPTPPEMLEPALELPKLTYETPDSWTEGDPTSMRVASFTATGDGGSEADISVIPLGGSGGAQLIIVNQWRATLRLDDVTEDQLPSLVESVEIGGHKFELVDFESEEPMIDERKARIVVAYATVGDYTWFFKIAGETELVAKEKIVLLKFLETVKFEESQ